MSSAEFQVAFGVKDSQVIDALHKVGIEIDRDEVFLVDEGVFQGMYSGDGECPEWLGLELDMLDNYSPFIDIEEINYEGNIASQTKHKKLYMDQVDKFLSWLKAEGYEGVDEVVLPEPTYFIACGTD